MFHVFKSRLCKTHAVRDCLNYVVIKGSSVHEYGFQTFHDRISLFQGK